jgi:adenine phosphoribosyltransferase
MKLAPQAASPRRAPVSELLAQKLVRDVPDFPKPGILFKDITPVLADPSAVREVIAAFAEFARPRAPDLIVGIESRGFMLGVPLALELNVGFAPVRKLGKLPYKTIREEYALEYGTNVVELHVDAIRPGQRVIVVDDLLATGGTAAASVRLVERLGGVVAGVCFMVELAFLNGHKVLSGYDTLSLVTFD